MVINYVSIIVKRITWSYNINAKNDTVISCKGADILIRNLGIFTVLLDQLILGSFL